MFSPILLATLQATVIAAISNVIAQLLEQRSKPVRLHTHQEDDYTNIILEQAPSNFSAPDFVRFVIFTLLTAPPNYLWQHALERLFPARKPSNNSKPTLPRYQIHEHAGLLRQDGSHQDEVLETRLNWKNTLVKWFLDCMTLGALLNVAAFIILMGIMKGRSSDQIANALRTVCTSTSLACCASTAWPLFYSARNWIQPHFFTGHFPHHLC